MSNTEQNIPDLEDRFLEPEGWRWHIFTHQGRKLRFGSVSPKDSIPDAVVVCLPGLSEFGEKYYETARTCLDMNLAFWVLDWMGQGLSDRYIPDSQKRHGQNFQSDVDDFHYFYMEYVKHSCVHPDVGRIPVMMLAHSMGANIGLRYLHQHPDVFECAAFSAPMLGLKTLEKIPLPLIRPVSFILGTILGKSYVSGGGDWDPASRPSDGPEALSNDPVRVKIHSSWFDTQPALQVGHVTYGWVHHALSSCARLNTASVLSQIQTPCLIALAGEETLIDNAKIRKAAARLPNCETIDFPNARHEILMEKDEIRKPFFKQFHALIKENIIDRPETLKPF